MPKKTSDKASKTETKKAKITVVESTPKKTNSKLTHEQTAQALAEELSSITDEIKIQKTPKGRCTILSIAESDTLMCFCFNGGSVTISDKLDNKEHLFSEMKRSYADTTKAGKFVRLYRKGHTDKALAVEMKPARTWGNDDAE